MAPFLGDFNTGVTIHFLWSSNNGAGASVTRAVNGTVQVYKNNGTTQSTTGITDTEDFDALTGIHACTIDLSSDGTFYSAGANFTVVLSGATIDGQSVNAVLAHFSIENRNAKVNVTQYGGVNGTFSDGRPEVNMTRIGGSTIDVNSAQLGVNAVNWAGTAVGSATIIAQANIAANAFTGAKFAANCFADTNFAASTGLRPAQSGTAQAGAAGSITLDAGASATTDFYQDMLILITGGTGAGQARICTAYNGGTKVASVAPNWKTNPDNTSTFAVCRWGAVGSVTGSVGSLAAQAQTDVKNQVVAGLSTDTYAEPAAVPAATSSLKDKIGWLFFLGRNKVTQTATTQTARNDGDSANVATSTHSDDGTTYTRGKWT